MQRFYLVLLLVLCSVLSCELRENPSRLVWVEDFNENVLDSTVWNVEEGVRNDAVNDKRMAVISDGNLHLNTKTFGDVHRTAIINTKGKFEMKTGYIEARVKFGNVPPGAWCAFWLYTDQMIQEKGRELDIFEHRSSDINGKDISNYTTSAVHWGGYGKNHQSLGNDSGDRQLSEGYHLYGMEVKESSAAFYIDGALYWTAYFEPSDAPMYIVLSVELSQRIEGWVKDLPPSLDGTIMSVDWIRVWAMP